MKIFYYIPSLHHPAGMERILSEKINLLADRGHDVTVVTTDGKGNTPAFPLRESVRVTDLGINYCDDAGLDPLRWHLGRRRRTRLHRKRLTELLRRERPDVSVSTFQEEARLIPAIGEAGYKVLEFHFSHDFRLLYGRRGIRHLIDRMRTRADERLAGRFDRFVVLTERDKEAWGKPDNIRVIPNFTTLTPPSSPAEREKVVLAAGRLTAEKGFDRLIEAWGLLEKDFPEWRLSICGEGALMEDLRARAARLGLRRVSLEGAVGDLMERMSRSSIFALTSRSEGFGIVLLEAATAGTPLVSMEAGAGSGLVEEGRNGFLTPDGDTGRFAGALRRLMSDPEQRSAFGAESRLIARRFSPSAIMDRWERIFRRED